MKILHISALPVWSMDGKGGMPSLRETLKGHLAGGYKIELVLPKYDPFSSDGSLVYAPDNAGFGFYFAECRWLPWLLKMRSSSRRFGKNRKLPYPLRWIFNLVMMFLLTCSLIIEARKVVKAGFAPDLVYAHNQYASLAGFLLGRWLKVPNVTRLYGTFLADLMSTPLVSLRYPTAVAGYRVPSDLLICGNDGTRGDEVARKFKIPDSRFRFWQNGVAPPSKLPETNRKDLVKRFDSHLREDSRWIVSCSRLAAWKRIDRMIDAVSKCHAEGVDCQLLVAGDGPKKTQLQQQASELHVEDTVVWLGAIAHDDIWALMHNADVFMITNDVTNRCNPLYEAAWAGLPVVSVFDPSTTDLLKHKINALLSDKENNDDLAKNLKEICLDGSLRKELGAQQLNLSKTFWSWEKRMEVEVEELEKLVAEKRK